MDNFDVSPSMLQPTVVDTAKELKLSGMSTPSGKRFFDNSMLDVMRVCPRKFYFRHIRNWEPEGIRMPLIFGSAWHAAMDFVWQNVIGLNDSQLLEGGMAAFLKSWTSSGLDAQSPMLMDYFPRTPTRGLEMLTKYIERYRTDLERIEIIAVETPFIVPLSLDNTDIFYIGKWDKVYRQRLGVTVLDHKTSSMFTENWISSFSPNGQMDGYLHAGHLTYGEEMYGVMIDGALVSKTKVDFQRIPLQRQIGQLNSWLWDTTDLIDMIELNEERLLEFRAEGPEKYDYLPAFPKCTTSCTQYYGKCPYMDLCKYIDNPELRTDAPGFQEATWVPFKIREDLKGELIIEMTEESN